MGGKRKVITEHLYKYLPESFDNYIEPFVGGGAMFCYLQPHRAILNDINTELMITYKIIEKNPIKLMEKLNELTNHHSIEQFYLVRKNLGKNNLDIAARFIYLNKTCFNGMYRVNAKNLFNVPINQKTKDNLILYDEKNLLNWSQQLKQKIKICNKDYLYILDMAKEHDFVFCDPPYDYENEYGFDAYSSKGFTQKDQINLANKLKELHDKKVNWMLTNHNTKLIHHLYQEFTIKPITTNRMINSNKNKRINTGKEVIIINYEKQF